MVIRKFILLIFCAFLLSAPTISAWDWDNVKSFDDKVGEYGEITIVNALGLGSDIADYTLDRNSDKCFSDCWAEGRTNLYEPGVLFQEVNFNDKYDINKELSYDIFVKNKRLVIKIDNVFEEVCTEAGEFNKSMTYDCVLKKIGTKDNSYFEEEWVLYDGKELETGFYEWRLEGVKGLRDVVDWVVSTMGVDFVEWAWWNGSYSYKREDSFDEYGVDGVPYLVNKSGFSFGNTNQNVWTISASQDVSNYLYYNDETDYFMTYNNQTSQVPQDVSYGNGSSYNPANVWDSNYLAVVHFDDKASGTSMAKDSTSNNNNFSLGTINRTMSNYGMAHADVYTGIPNDARFFDGVYTLEMWISVSNTEGHKELFDTRDSGGSFGTRAYWSDNGDHTISWADCGGDLSVVTPAWNPVTGVYHHLAFVWNGTANLIYIDGVSQTLTGTHSASCNVVAPLCMGSSANICGAEQNVFVGSRLDEFRYSNVARSEDYIKAMFVQLNSTLGVETTANEPPNFDAISSFSKDEDFVSFSLNLSDNISDIEDPDSSLNVSYVLNDSSVFGISIDNITNFVTFTSIADQFGSVEVVLTVIDTGGLTNSTTFDFTVNAVNDNPLFDAISDIVLDEDFSPVYMNLSLNVSDVETAQVSLLYHYVSNDSSVFDVEINNATGNFTLRNLPNQFGSVLLNITVIDEGGLTNSTEFNVVVNSVPDSPTFDPISSFSLSEDFGSKYLNLSLNTSDAETSQTNLLYHYVSNDSSVFSVEINNATGNLTFRSLTNQFGSVLINITVIDESNSKNSTEFSLTIDSVNDQPNFDSVSSFSLNEDFGSYTVNVSNNISDIETSKANLKITYTLNDSTIFSVKTDNSTHEYTFTSIADQDGSVEVNFTVWDEDGGSNFTTFDFTVNAVNDNPLFDPISSFSLNEDFGSKYLNLSLNASDVETVQTNLLYTYTSNSSGIFNVEINNATGNLTFRSIANQSGSVLLNITVIDESNSKNSTSFDLTVNQVADPPTFDAISSFSMDARFNSLTLNLTNNISDVETSKTNLQVSYVLNDSAGFSVSIDNSTNLVVFTQLLYGYRNVDVNLTVLDESGLIASVSFIFSVEDFNVTTYTWEDSENIWQGSQTELKLYVNLTNIPLTSAFLVWNGTNYGQGTRTKIASNSYRFVNKISVPLNVGEGGGEFVSYYWNYSILTAENGTVVDNQTVFPIGIDNCSVYDVMILNYSLYDEASRSNVGLTNASIEVDFEMTSYYNVSESWVFNITIFDVNARICISNFSSNLSYRLDSVAKYECDDQVSEYHYVVNYNLSNSSRPVSVSLYDLKTVDATEFLITFKDSNYLPVENAVVDSWRYYVGDGEFVSVEHGKTNDQGQAIMSFVVEDIIYKFFIRKDNVLLWESPQYQVICQTTPCTLALQQNPVELGLINYDVFDNVDYSFVVNESARRVSVVYSSVDGSSVVAVLNVTLFDSIGNRTVCYTSETAGGGTLVCTIDLDESNATYIARLSFDGEFASYRLISLARDAIDHFGYTGIIMTALIFGSLVGMALTTGVGVVIFGILGVVMATLMGIFNGGNIFGKGSVLLWLIVAGGILLWKISQRRVQ